MSVSIEIQISVYMKLDKVSAFHCDLDFYDCLSAVKFCLFFHVNAYGCSEILLCSEEM